MYIRWGINKMWRRWTCHSHIPCAAKLVKPSSECWWQRGINLSDNRRWLLSDPGSGRRRLWGLMGPAATQEGAVMVSSIAVHLEGLMVVINGQVLMDVVEKEVAWTFLHTITH